MPLGTDYGGRPQPSGRVGQLLLFGRFFVVSGVLRLSTLVYFRTTCLLLSLLWVVCVCAENRLCL